MAPPVLCNSNGSQFCPFSLFGLTDNIKTQPVVQVECTFLQAVFERFKDDANKEMPMEANGEIVHQNQERCYSEHAFRYSSYFMCTAHSKLCYSLSFLICCWLVSAFGRLGAPLKS